MIRAPAAAMVAVTIFISTSASSVQASPDETSSQAVSSLGFPLDGIALEELPATRAFPLFAPTRLPPPAPVQIVEPPPAALPPPPPPPPPSLQLIGIMKIGRDQVALLSDLGSGQIHRLCSGEVFGEWTMRITDARSIAFEHGEERQTQHMFSP